MGKIALINGTIVLPVEILDRRSIVIDQDKILDIGEVDSLRKDIDIVDVEGRIIVPGMIDLHTHGAMGYTFNEPSPGAFQTITTEFLKHGVTALLATLATASTQDLVSAMDFCRHWMASAHSGAQILGVHLEGPYFHPEQRGAQDPNNLRTPDDGSLDEFLAYRDVIKIMSFAPELPGAFELTERLSRMGIIPAAGHSSAIDEDITAAIELGLRHVIHLWSGQSTTRRDGPWRKPGLLETALASDHLTGEIIADNKHLPPTLLKLAYKCFGAERLCLVSDSTSGAGLADGEHFVMGDMEYYVKDGVGMMLDDSAFAGSVTMLNKMVSNLVSSIGVSLIDAIRMVSLTPASVLGIDGQKGSLEIGKDADIAILEQDFSVWRTMRKGQWVYPFEEKSSENVSLR
jgi:N-acetylglucosamine-6-phosphate deacetylase